MNTRNRLTIIAGLVAALPWGGRAAAQSVGDLGVSAHNQTEYSRSKDGDTEILLEWLDLEATYGDFVGGMRYEAFQPPRPADPLGEEIREGFAYRYIEMNRDWGTLRAGNSYALFGRGLTLNLFEDRNVRIDANLDGIQYHGESHGVAVTALTGRARATTIDRWRSGAPSVDRQDLVHAADVTFQPIPALRLGGSLVTDRYPASVSTDVLREMRGGRTELYAGPLAVYAEYARVENPQDTLGVGRGRYVSATLSGPGFGLFAEARNYDQFGFHTNDSRIYLNNPPAGTREHAYTLLNRHPHSLNAQDEKGYQLEATFTPREGTELTLNNSDTRDHRDVVLFREYYSDLHLEPGGRWSNVVGVIDHLKDRSSSTRNLTLIGEGTAALTEAVSLRLEFGNQHTEDAERGEWDDHLAVIEVSRSPGITAGFSQEWTNRADENFLPGEDTTTSWTQVNLGLQLVEDTDIAITYGSRQAGYYCVGGRCRLEPAFEGVEFKVQTHF